jgi:hypothetical protein
MATAAETIQSTIRPFEGASGATSETSPSARPPARSIARSRRAPSGPPQCTHRFVPAANEQLQASQRTS